MRMAQGPGRSARRTKDDVKAAGGDRRADDSRREKNGSPALAIARHRTTPDLSPGISPCSECPARPRDEVTTDLRNGCRDDLTERNKSGKVKRGDRFAIDFTHPLPESATARDQ